MRLEMLESRLLLAAVAWDGDGDGVSWSDPLNWSHDLVPSSDDDVTISIPGDTSIVLRGDQPRIRSLINHETLLIQGTTSSGFARLTVSTEVENYGTVVLDTASNDSHNRSAYLQIDEGGFINQESGVFEVRKGAGDSRYLVGNLINRGNVTIESGITLSMIGTQPTVEQLGGELSAAGQLFLDTGTFQFSSGEVTGLIRLKSTQVDIAETVTTEATLRVVGPNNTLVKNAAENVSVWIEGTSTWGWSRLTTLAGAVNHGTIRMETTSNDSHDRGTYLTTATDTTFVNESTGRIVAVQGQGDTRSITGKLTNRGTLEVAAGESATFSGSLVSDGGVYSGSLRVLNSDLSFLQSPSSSTSISVYGQGNALHTDIPLGQTLKVLGTTTYGWAGLNSPTGFTNHGTLRLETTSNDSHDRGVYVTVTEGTLINAASGVIDVRTGDGDGRHLSGNITNQGELKVESGETLSVSGNNPRVIQAGGSLVADGQFRLNNGAFEYTGGVVSGLVRLNSSQVDVADSVTTEATLRVVGPNNTLVKNAAEDVTVWIEGTTTWGWSRLTTLAGAVNRGTIRMETTSNDSHNRGTYLATATDTTFVNESTGRIVAVQGQGDTRSITGSVTNRGAFEVGAGESATFMGTLLSDGGVYTGSLLIRDSDLAFLQPPSQPTSLNLYGPSNVLHTDIPLGQTLKVYGTTTYGWAGLTSPTGFTNHGTLRLETTSNDSHDRGVYVTVTEGTLINAASGVIDVRTGDGDGRSLSGNITNHGELKVESGETLSVSGNNPKVIQAGGSLVADGQFRLNNGAFEYTGGDVSGLVRLNSSQVDVADSVTTEATLRVVGPNNTLVKNAAENVTLWIEGTTTWGWSRMTTLDGAMNRGTIQMETTTNDSHDRGAYLATAADTTFVNERSGRIVAVQGRGDARSITGSVTNRGAFEVGAGESATFIGTLLSDGGVYTGSLLIRDSVLSFLQPPSSPTSLSLYGRNNVLQSDIPLGQTLKVLGTTSYGWAGLTSPTGFTNYGTLRLETTSNDSHNRGVYVTVTEGTLINAASGVIDVRAGDGDGRRLDTELRNEGTLLADINATIGRLEAHHTNFGLIGLDGSTLSIQGSSLTNHPGGYIGGRGSLSTGQVVLANDGIVDTSRPGVQKVSIDPGLIEISFASPVGMDVDTVTAIESYQILGSGGDGTFGDGNEQNLSDQIASVTFDSDSQTVSLALATPLDADSFRIVLNGETLQDTAGTSLLAETLIPINRQLGTIPTLVSIDLQSSSDTGYSDHDDLTNDSTPTFDVTVNKGGRIDLDWTGDGTVDIAFSVPGPGTYALTPAGTISDGEWQVLAALVPLIGESQSTSIPISIDTQGPKWLPGLSQVRAPLVSRTLFFDEPIDASFSSTSVSLTGPGNTELLSTAITGDSLEWHVEFPPAIDAGDYTLTGSLQIFDLAGNAIDQNGNGIGGELEDVPSESFAVSADVLGPIVTSVNPLGLSNAEFSSLEVGFGERITPSSFNSEDVLIVGPDGLVSQALIQVETTSDRTFLISLPAQSLEGDYRIQIGPDVQDISGNAMGTDESAAFHGLLTLDRTGPQVLESIPSGMVESAVSFVEVTFDSHILAATFLANDVTFSGPLGPIATGVPQATGPRTFVIPFSPQSANGDYTLEIGPGVADMAGNNMLQNAPGAYTSEFQIVLPDLEVPSESLGTSAASALFGDSIQVSWQVKNTGAGVAQGIWRDAVWLSHDDQLSSDDLRLSSVFNEQANLPVGAHYDSAVQVTLPEDRDLTPGAYYLLVTADLETQLVEASELNNTASIPVELDYTSLPELNVSQIVAPLTGTPGTEVILEWTVTNSGSAAVEGTWREQVFLSDDSDIGSDKPVAVFDYIGELQPSESRLRRESISIPSSGLVGDTQFVVVVDTLNQIIEEDESNNSAIDSDTFNVPASLTLSASESAVFEATVNPALRAVVTRNGDLSEPLHVNLTVDNADELGLPASLTIPAGQPSQAFEIIVQSDEVVDGDQTVNVTAQSNGLLSSSTQITVLDSDLPVLDLSFSREVMVEGDTTTATLTRDVVSAQSIIVSLSASTNNQLLFPPSVTIPANEHLVTFEISATNDSLLESDQLVEIHAVGSEIIGTSADVQVLDNDDPGLVLEIDAETISEADGSTGTTAVLRRTNVTNRELVVRLSSSDTSEMRVPSTVRLPATVPAVRFFVAAMDDDLVDGTQSVTLTATALDTQNGDPLPSTSVTGRLDIADDDGPTLFVTAGNALVAEGIASATTLTVRRNTDPTGELIVDLRSNDETELVLPSQLVIPDGQTSASFAIDTIEDNQSDGNQPVSIEASSDGFTSGFRTLTVTDIDLPDLVVSDLDVPTAAETSDLISVFYELQNQGIAASNGSIIQRVFLSDDALIGDDTLLGQFVANQTLTVGATDSQVVPLEMPLQPGDYWVVVSTDVADNVVEGLESNNTTIAGPIRVEAEYQAIVETQLESALANTPVPLTGSATLSDGTTPATNVDVDIHVTVRGTRRTFSVPTDSQGNFTYTFTPLPNEAGVYGVAATHPGIDEPASQDAFTLIGMQAVPVSPSIVVKEGEAAKSISVLVKNLSDAPLTSVTVDLAQAPENLIIDLDLEGGSGQAGLAALGELSFAIQVTAIDASLPRGEILLEVTTNEGATLQIPVAVTVTPLSPRLESSIQPIVAGMVRGEQRIVEFDVTNRGGAPTGALDIRLPNNSWLNLAVENTLPSLAPGESATVSLLLTPSADQTLGVYSGTIIIDNDQVNLSVGYRFRSISSARGDLSIEVVDEYTYYADGEPRVAGATVILQDEVTGEVIADGVTDENGRVMVPDVTEGYYQLLVRAEDHTNYREVVFIEGGTTTEIQPFLAREVVKYIFDVVPTTIDDRTRIEIETVFETNVPAPVVVIEPTVINFDDLVFRSGEAQLEFSISNYGLVAAQEVFFELPTHPDYKFDALVQDIGVLPANSSLVIPVTIRDISVNTGTLRGRVTTTTTQLDVHALPIQAENTITGEISVVETLGDGSFSVGDLEFGVYRVRVLSNRVFSDTIEIRIDQDNHTRSIEFSVVAGGILRGNATNILGEAVVNAGVIARSTIYEPVLATTDANGNYEFPPLGKGEWEIQFTASPNNRVSDVVSIDVNTNESITQDFVLEVGATITGTAYDSGGAPLPGVAIQTKLEDGTPYTAITDANGNYRFNSLAPNEYELQTFAIDYTSQVIQLTVASSDIEGLDLFLSPSGEGEGASPIQPYLDRVPHTIAPNSYSDSVRSVLNNVAIGLGFGLPRSGQLAMTQYFVFGASYALNELQVFRSFLQLIEDGIDNLVGNRGAADGEELFRYFSAQMPLTRNHVTKWAGFRRSVDTLYDEGSYADNAMRDFRSAPHPFTRLEQAVRDHVAILVAEAAAAGQTSLQSADFAEYQPNMSHEGFPTSFIDAVEFEPNWAIPRFNDMQWAFSRMDSTVVTWQAFDIRPANPQEDCNDEYIYDLQIEYVFRDNFSFKPHSHRNSDSTIDLWGYLIENEWRMASSTMTGIDTSSMFAQERVEALSSQGESCNQCSTDGAVHYVLRCGAGDINYRNVLRILGIDGDCRAIPRNVPNDTNARQDPVDRSPIERQPAANCNDTAGGEGEFNAGEGEGNGLCAQVRVQLDQTSVQTRDAFEARLQIINDTADSTLTDLDVDIYVFDASGAIVNELFGIRDPILSGTSAVDGTGVIDAGGVANSSWIIIPSILSAPEAVTQYYVGGILAYKQDGRELSIDLNPVRISVLPTPQLHLQYFQERDVFSDDPFTIPIEPALPFSLGFIVNNDGAGTADDLRIESAQPRIIDNARGLDTSFTIVGSEVNGIPQNASLTVNLGDIGPGESAVGQWIMTSPVQGHFIEFEASFVHEDSLRTGVDVSLIRSVEIYEMTRAVFADRSTDDDLQDFLTNDLEDPEHTPDTLHLSDGSIETVGLMTEATFDNPPELDDLQIELSTEAAEGWRYLRIADPSQGAFRLERVVRPDGSEVRSENYWYTDRTFLNRGERPVYEDVLHLLDYEPQGSYTLHFAARDQDAPQVVDIQEVAPNPTASSVHSVDITFSELIDSASFDIADVTLTRGGVNLIGPNVEIVQQSDVVYRLTGLETSTQADGEYILSVNADGVQDQFGNPGQGVAATTWTKSEAAPAIVAITGVDAQLINQPIPTVDVTFTHAINPSTFSPDDLTLSLDGSLVSGIDSLEFLQVRQNTFRIFGLEALTDADGTYELTVDATGVRGIEDLIGVGSGEVSWMLDTTGPSLTDLVGLPNGVTNEAVDVIQVIFDSAVDAESLDLSDVTLTRNNAALELDSRVALVPFDAHIIQILGLENFTSGEGSYSITFDGLEVFDPAANTGSGRISKQWSVDLTPPQPALEIQIAPDVGHSNEDQITNSRKLIISGRINEAERVRVTDLTSQIDFGSVEPVDGRFEMEVELVSDGFHVLNVEAIDAAGNASVASTIELYVDSNAPVATLPPLDNFDPRGDALEVIPLVFNEPVFDLNLNDIQLVRDDQVQDAIGSGATLDTSDQASWEIRNLSALTTLPGFYEARIEGNAGNVQDRAGNGLSQPTSLRWRVEPRWQNPRERLDVNNDTFVSPIDALLGISYLNQDRPALLPAQAPAANDRFFDVSGDGYMTPIDVLIVINAINARGLAGEGEAIVDQVYSEHLDDLLDTERNAPFAA